MARKNYNEFRVSEASRAIAAADIVRQRLTGAIETFQAIVDRLATDTSP